jgi:pyruvate,orthophosphate dikinase
MALVEINGSATKRHSAEEIGAKAANLAHMAALGLPVPPAFVLPITRGAAHAADAARASRRLADDLAEGIRFLETATGLAFGDRRRPLIVSVRSGAARSMPGMLDTVLDVGCAPDAVEGLMRLTGNPRFAWDCRRRFLESYASVVLGADSALLSKRLAGLAASERVPTTDALDGEALERLAGSYKDALEAEDYALPETAMEQLIQATRAVYRSWTSDRARTYRRVQHLDYLVGTAVTVQAMVFGNRGLSSGAGVAFSRDCSTGAPAPVIDVLFAAQGEDVVSGQRNPETETALERTVPAAAKQLCAALAQLEREFRDVQDVEFTVEEGKLWLLQTRTAKRTAAAALRFAVDFVREGLIAPEDALDRLHGLDIRGVTRTHFVDAGAPIVRSVGASSGVAVGRAAFDSMRANLIAARGDPVILMRPTTSTSDIEGFTVAAGIATAAGGRTAHAALVARQMGKPCVVGCADLAIDVAARRAQLGGATIDEGSWLSLDGTEGTIYLGRHEIASERPEAELSEVERWRSAAAVVPEGRVVSLRL